MIEEIYEFLIISSSSSSNSGRVGVEPHLPSRCPLQSLGQPQAGADRTSGDFPTCDAARGSKRVSANRGSSLKRIPSQLRLCPTLRLPASSFTCAPKGSTRRARNRASSNFFWTAEVPAFHASLALNFFEVFFEVFKIKT